METKRFLFEGYPEMTALVRMQTEDNLKEIIASDALTTEVTVTIFIDGVGGREAGWRILLDEDLGIVYKRIENAVDRTLEPYIT